MTVNDLRLLYLSPSASSPLAPEDFYVLLAHASGKSREFLLAHPEHGLDAETEARARAYFARRLSHEPVAYIVGEKEFFGLPFRVTRDTLIPRSETEMLVERAIEDLRLKIEESDSKPEKNILIADIGTGSGAIIVSVAMRLRTNNPQSPICNLQFDLHAIDTSSAALTIAKENAERNDVANTITFHEGSLIEPIKKYFSGADEIMLVANLPYLSKAIYASADDDVTKYEPQSALYSGIDGLDHYRALFASIAEIIPTLPSYHLSVLCEISPEQDELITKLFAETFPGRSSLVLPDLSGRSRVFSFRLDKHLS
jgi:release factor glutamine methyltransferase